MKEYFYQGSDGERYGPATVEMLNQWAIQGRITNDSWVIDAETEERVWVRDIEGFIKAPPVKQVDPPKRSTPLPPIENHLLKAVFSCCCCCLPFGIIAIVYATQVDGHRIRGDINAARDAADKASAWANAAILVGILSSLLYVLVMQGSNQHVYR